MHFLGLVNDDMLEAIIALNIAVAILSSDNLARKYVNEAEQAIERFLQLAEELFGDTVFTLNLHQVGQEHES